jgi:phosphohistidine phosphatase SixA
VLLASQAGWEPDLVLASNSKRTKLTLNEMTTVMESLEAVDTHLMGWVYY